MRIWRISNYADLSGIGGTHTAERWNHLGTRIVYCAEHPALAMLEILVHLNPENLPESYKLLEIDVPQEIEAETIDLPDNWTEDPTTSRDAFAAFCKRGSSPLLNVPSIIMPHSRNFLINPLHTGVQKLAVISAETYSLDPRFLT